MKFTKGNLYKLYVIIPPKRLPRESVLTYLGDNQWNARPAAGTQELDPKWIVAAEDLGRGKGRDDKRHYVNRTVRSIPAQSKTVQRA